MVSAASKVVPYLLLGYEVIPGPHSKLAPLYSTVVVSLLLFPDVVSYMCICSSEATLATYSVAVNAAGDGTVPSTTYPSACLQDTGHQVKPEVG